MTTRLLADDQGRKAAVAIPMADRQSLMDHVAVSVCWDDGWIFLSQLKKQLIADGLLAR